MSTPKPTYHEANVTTDFKADGFENQPERSSEKRCSHKRRRAKRMVLEYKKTGDPSAREAVLANHLGLVGFYARQYADRGMDYDDLFQEGCLGLLAALDRFDPSLGFEFSTYASHFIRGYILEFYRTKAWPCSVPRSVRDMSFQIRMLETQLGHEPTRQEVLDFCDIPPERADEALIAAQVWHPACFHHANTACDINPTVHPHASSVDTDLEETPMRMDMQSLLTETLDAEELEVVHMRYFEDLSQREIAQQLGTHQMYVSRSLHKSMDKLEQALLVNEDAQTPDIHQSGLPQSAATCVHLAFDQ